MKLKKLGGEMKLKTRKLTGFIILVGLTLLMLMPAALGFFGYGVIDETNDLRKFDTSYNDIDEIGADSPYDALNEWFDNVTDSWSEAGSLTIEEKEDYDFVDVSQIRLGDFDGNQSIGIKLEDEPPESNFGVVIWNMNENMLLFLLSIDTELYILDIENEDYYECEFDERTNEITAYLGEDVWKDNDIRFVSICSTEDYIILDIYPNPLNLSWIIWFVMILLIIGLIAIIYYMRK